MATLATAIEAVQRKWCAESIGMLAGVASAKIAFFEETYHVVLPTDLRTFFSLTNGMGGTEFWETDSDMTSFWPLPDEQDIRSPADCIAHVAPLPKVWDSAPETLSDYFVLGDYRAPLDRGDFPGSFVRGEKNRLLFVQPGGVWRDFFSSSGLPTGSVDVSMPFLRALPPSTRQAGVAVHIVNQVAEVVVLGGSFEPDAPAEVRSHLRHPREDVFHSHPHPADGVVALPLLFAERVRSGGFAQQELLRVALDQMGFMLRAVVGAVGEYGLVSFIKEFCKYLAVVHAGGRGAGAEDEFGF